MFSFRGISPKCSAFKSNSHNAYRFCPFVRAIPMLVTPCLTNEVDWEGGGWEEGCWRARGGMRDSPQARPNKPKPRDLSASRSEGFRKRQRLAVVSFLQRAKSFSRKKDAEIARVCKTRALSVASPAIETRRNTLPILQKHRSDIGVLHLQMDESFYY